MAIFANPRARGYELHLRISDGTLHGPKGSLPLRKDDRLIQDLLLLLLRETAGEPLDTLLEQFGYHSRATYYAKLRRYREGGMAQLAAQRTGPRRPWRRSQEVVDAIVNLRREDGDRSSAEIARLLKLQGIRISQRSVERTLTESGLSRQRE